MTCLYDAKSTLDLRVDRKNSNNVFSILIINIINTQGIKITWNRGSEGKKSYSLFFSELELDIR